MKKILLASTMALLMTTGLFAQNHQRAEDGHYYKFDVDKKVEHMAEKLDLNAAQKQELREYFMLVARDHDDWYINNRNKREMIEKKREWIEKKREWNREKWKWNRSKRIAHEKKMRKILGIKKYKMYQDLEKAHKKAIKKQQKIEKKRRKEMHKRRKEMYKHRKELMYP